MPFKRCLKFKLGRRFVKFSRPYDDDIILPERDRERHTERETERDRERQRDRETERQRVTESDRE